MASLVIRRGAMKDPKPSVDRRAVMAGAGAVGALAAAASLLPGAKPETASTQAASAAPPDTAAGYRLTEHVKRYYATARI
jgi:hypothetical protein